MKKYLLAGGLAIAFFIIQILTLSDYGINWDGPYRMIRGQIFLQLLTTGTSTFPTPQSSLSPMVIKPGEYATRYDFLDGEEGNQVALPQNPLFKKDFLSATKGQRTSFYQHNGFEKYFTQSLGGHLALGDIFAAFSNRVLWQSLGLFGDIPSYQVSYIFLASFGIFFTTLLAIDISGSFFAGIIAGCVLGMFPLFFAESHFNMKDPTQAAFFTGIMWGIWQAVKTKKTRWLVVIAVCAAITAGIKWNSIFLPFILAPWLLLLWKRKELPNFLMGKRLFLNTLLILISILILSFITFPPAWQNPLGQLIGVVQYYLSLGTQPVPFQPSGFIFLGCNFYPFLLFFFQTPEIVLVLIAVGLFSLVRKKQKYRPDVLLSAWILVSLLRVMLPHVWFYNGLRQIMEIVPVLAIGAGIGSALLVQKISNAKYPMPNIQIILKTAFVLLVFAVLAFPLIHLHPNENVYFNTLIGGVRGAAKAGLIDNKITYGNAYKQAADWLSIHAERDAKVAFLDGPMYSLSPLFLREDIRISPQDFSGYEKKGEYILVLYNSSNPSVFAYQYPLQILRPVHEIKAGSQVLLSIYKNTEETTREVFRKEETTTQFTLSQGESEKGKYIQIHLPEKQSIARIDVFNPLPTCLSSYSQFADEFIQLDSSSESYLLQERKRDNNMVAFFFSGEKTNIITIYPQDGLSCFVTGEVKSITTLHE